MRELVRIKRELFGMAERYPHLRQIDNILFHPGFPVDARHTEGSNGRRRRALLRSRTTIRVREVLEGFNGRRSLASNHFRTILVVFRGLERCGSRSNSADKLLLKFQRRKELNRLRAVTLSRRGETRACLCNFQAK